ncbi:hypothetical protein BDA99DRAFT_493988, partial [Phascolomyces articulosus]
MTNATVFPVIDFSEIENRSAEIAHQILEACKTVGFFYITNHNGPTTSEFTQMFEMVKTFFAQPAEFKTQFETDQLDCRGGYTAITPKYDMNNMVTQAKTVRFEGFEVSPRDLSNQKLPNMFTDNKKELDLFFKKMHSVGISVLELLAIALKVTPNQETGANDYLSSYHRYGDEASSATSLVRFMNYPALKENDSSGNNIEEEVVCGAHTDYGSITLLSHRDIGGLQVDIDGVWTDVPKVQDALLVNLGGTLMHWTRGLLKASNHRVIATPKETKNRYVITYFMQPETDVKLADIPSPLLPSIVPNLDGIPTLNKIVSAEDYIKERFIKAYKWEKKEVSSVE